MKKLFIISAVFLFMSSCSNNDKTAATTTNADSTRMSSAPDMKQKKEERNKQKAIASITAFSNHETEGVFKDMSQDAMDYGDGSDKPASVDTVRAMAQRFLKSFPDIKADNLMAMTGGEWVTVCADWSATFKNDMGAMKATGKTYKWKDCDMFKFNDSGKIIEHRSIYPVSNLFK
jgi:predicted ester cyclase